MASNKDLIEEIEKIDADAVTEGFSNKDLNRLLASLQDPGATGEPVAEEPKGYKVAEGKAITSMRGVLGEGEPVQASDFPGGEDSLKALVKSGSVVK